MAEDTASFGNFEEGKPAEPCQPPIDPRAAAYSLASSAEQVHSAYSSASGSAGFSPRQTHKNVASEIFSKDSKCSRESGNNLSAGGIGMDEYPRLTTQILIAPSEGPDDNDTNVDEEEESAWPIPIDRGASATAGKFTTAVDMDSLPNLLPNPDQGNGARQDPITPRIVESPGAESPRSTVIEVAIPPPTPAPAPAP
eukprot:Hpha_TRINITY_DN34312_c0_g1::TRINITY_DN34312_c0_g1_i1::g.109576::m.109576